MCFLHKNWFRTEYYHHFYKNVRSIFDKKIKADDDSLSEEEKYETYDNEIQFWRDVSDSVFDNNQTNSDQNDWESRSVTRARDAPYRMIVIPGYLYESFDLYFIKEIL